MHPRLRDLDRAQGYFLTRDALAAGYTTSAFYRARRAGEIVAIRHGTYAVASTWRERSEVDRHRARLSSALERADVGHVASHTSAVVLHTDGHWGLDLSTVHLTHPRRRSERRESGLAHHRAVLPEEHVVDIGGVPTVVPARAAVELSTIPDTERSLVVMDSLLREGRMTVGELDAMVTHARNWPGTLHTAVAASLASPLAGSVGESRLFYRLWRGGIPAPVRQHPVYDGSELVAVLDLWWPEHGVAGEFDGAVTYTRLLRPGESAADAVVREKVREDRVRELLDCGFVRYVWHDLDDQDRLVVRTRRALGLPMGAPKVSL
ncbi:type IV toxin-antitoxin system AbiEi family antitoxin domain-containing protein [Nocardioides zeae]|uniref:Type IV toxin-antitoxin system AbiEi family antitoxin domain-containing protein n=1 Tax=Nocardioides zeae TaxID=1457234 RepID=A0A6P0HID6_9ACTN|nr:type IV toxin-antitoxin system AbiEi family antitoxin domain-containing protein [Nocardioides zeae]NEN78371.1 type IV toxin-antitoxin system AbiEi family antitoxin domain-containing protein [Nocardioides zeae]